MRRNSAPSVLLVACVVLAGCGEAATGPAAAPRPLPINAQGTFVTPAPIEKPFKDNGVNPTTLVIPRLHVSAAVEHVGQTADHAMESPRRPDEVAWYSLGFRPGEQGHAVIAGHLDSTDRRHPRAVFADLGKLRAGDALTVSGGGRTLSFTVSAVASYAESQFPLETVFGAGEERTLELITCTGTYRGGRAGYTRRLVVTAVEQPA